MADEPPSAGYTDLTTVYEPPIISVAVAGEHAGAIGFTLSGNDGRTVQYRFASVLAARAFALSLDRAIASASSRALRSMLNKSEKC